MLLNHMPLSSPPPVLHLPYLPPLHLLHTIVAKQNPSNHWTTISAYASPVAKTNPYVGAPDGCKGFLLQSKLIFEIQLFHLQCIYKFQWSETAVSTECCSILSSPAFLTTFFVWDCRRRSSSSQLEQWTTWVWRRRFEQSFQWMNISISILASATNESALSFLLNIVPSSICSEKLPSCPLICLVTMPQKCTSSISLSNSLPLMSIYTMSKGPAFPATPQSLSQGREVHLPLGYLISPQEEEKRQSLRLLSLGLKL